MSDGVVRGCDGRGERFICRAVSGDLGAVAGAGWVWRAASECTAGLSSGLTKPVENLLRVGVGREDRIEHVLDPVVADDEGQSRVETVVAGGAKCGQAKCVCQVECRIRKHGERKM